MMMIYPDLKKIKELAETGQYQVAPVSTEILSDICTPIEALSILKNVSKHTYLLESLEDKERWGRYTFMGYDPVLDVTALDGKIEVNMSGDPSEADPSLQPKEGIGPTDFLRELLAKYKSPSIQDLPPFTGGLVGYFSFDYLAYSEPSAKRETLDSEQFKDCDLMLFDRVIAFDHVKQKIILIANVRLSDPEQEFEKAKEALSRMKDLLLHGERKKEAAGVLKEEPKPLFDRETYCAMVEKGKRYIKEGDIFQIVLSNRLEAAFEGSLFNTYRILRTLNPSPYMFYFSGTDVEVAGASPETLVKQQNGVLHTFPLAGTRPRGKTRLEDLSLEEELLSDEKELAEHNMLVDLGRNDLGKISKFGTVNVEKLHEIERYSHVMHIGSTVCGKIRDDKDALDAIRAVLPAGTLSGAPKIRACQLIGELENNKRGIYGGAIGYIDFTGNMDTCIAIRIAYKKNGKVFVRSGAGIVFDSVPEKEHEECLNKARAVITALKQAGEEEAL